MSKEKMQDMIDTLATIKGISYNSAKKIIVEAFVSFEKEIKSR